MKKQLIILTIMLFTASLAFASAGEYSFSSSTGTYTEITGGTVSTASGQYGAENIDLPFTFNYTGIDYATARISVNGWLEMGQTYTGQGYINYLSSTTWSPFLAPLWDNLYARGAPDNTEIRYETTGTAPNRIFIVQWKNICWWSSGSTVNFQVKLEETTNKIHFCYGTNNSTESRSASIGINDASSGSCNFLSVTPGTPPTTSTTSDNNSISTDNYPGDGVIYTFEMIGFDMEYTSGTTTQDNTDDVRPGFTNYEVIGIEIVATCGSYSIDATSFTFNTTGTTAVSDIENARLWYTISNSFHTNTQIGSVVAAPNGSFTITGTQTLEAGTNYFWLSYDVKDGAVEDNFIDAECTSVTVDGSAEIPTVTAPAGNRQNKRFFVIGTGTSTQYNIPSRLRYNYGWSATIFLASEINSYAVITKLSYYVGNSPSNYVTDDQKIYMCNTDDATFTDATKPDPSSMTLVYDGTITWNGSGWHEIALTTTFGYDYNKNLMIYYENRDGSGITSGYPEWRYTGTYPDYRAKYDNGYSFPTGSGSRTYNRPNIKIEYDQASAMAYSSCTTTQDNIGTVQPGVANREIIGIEVVTTGLTDPIGITSFTLNTTGTTSAADIENAKLWYTGSSSNFATDNQFGVATAAPDGSFTITGTQTLTNGTNYFWLTYDIKLDATVGNFVDAECTQINDNAKAAHVPTVTAPTGNRQIERLVIVGTGTITRNTTPFYGYNDYSWSAAIFLASEINISADITKLSYDVSNGPSNFVINDQKIYMFNTDDADFADASKPDPSSMTLVYDGTITWNGSGWHEITLATTFGYDNSKNLMIYYENHDGSAAASGCPAWHHTSTSPNYRSKYYCADGSFPNGDGVRLSDRPNIKIEYDEVSDMAYSSSTVTQNNTYSVKLGSDDAEIVGIQVITTGVTNPVNLTQFSLNTTGCTNASNDIVNAKLWCTGSSSTFATTSQFGATHNNPNGTFNITGSQQLLAGKNYFWLTYSIAPGATEENVVDAQCTQITDNAKAAHVPTVTAPAGSRTIKGALNGTYSIGATGYYYASISDAIADLGILGVDGACTFHLRDATYAESPMTINPITGASATNTITFKPYAGVSPTITITVINDYDAGFLLNGADHIIFDGSNSTTSRDMAIVMAGDDSRAFMLSGGDGATYNTIKNCVIEGYANSSNNNGIRVDGTGHDNNIFENNEIYKNGYGIRLYGSSSADNTGNVVKDNVIGSGTAAKYIGEYGIRAERQTNLEISGNEIYNILYNYQPYGIYIYDSDNVTVSKNNIHDIVSTGTSGYGGCGIYVYIMSSGSNIIIKNNLIRHIAGGGNAPDYVPTGIRLRGFSSSSGVKMYYNSIYLTPDANYGLSYENNNWAAAITIDNGPTQIDMRNNILRMSLGEKTGSTNTTYGYAIWCKGSSEPFSSINNNIYYVDNQDNNYVGLVGTAVPPTGNKTLSAWRSFSQGDGNSTDSDPLYISTTDLHLSVGSPAFNAGSPIGGITTDYEGETRNVTTPTIGAYETPSAIYVWEGTTNNDWHTVGNWRSSAVPTDANDVTVPVGCTNYPTITTAATCNDITVESDATGDASLIDNGNHLTASGNITIERYLTDGQWHFVSAPVDNATVNSLYFNGSPEVWLKEFHESGIPSDWEYITNLTTPMPFGKGFACWVGTAKTIVTAEFQGSLRTSNLTLTTTSTPALSFTDAAHGFNLVGNPFASTLDWDIGSWDTTNVEGSIWIWDPATTGYKYRNAQELGSLTDGIIPLCQAFFIRAKTAAPSFTIPIDARVHSAQAYYKNSKTNKDLPPYIILTVEKDMTNDEVWICFTEEGTYGFDNGWDVSKFFSSSELPQLYLQELGNTYSIDVLPPLAEEGRIVAMGFEAGTDGAHSITASSLEHMPETGVVLEDLKTGILHDLHISPEYQFTAAPWDDPDRFLVHFSRVYADMDNDKGDNALVIYSYGDAVYVKSGGDLSKKAKDVFVYDMFGRKVVETTARPSTLTRIPMNVNNGYFVVKVITDGKVHIKNVFVH